MKAKSTLPARNAQASPAWRTDDAICQGSVLPMMPVCAKLGLNRPVIRWMSVKPALAGAPRLALQLSPKARIQGTVYRCLQGIGFGQFEEGSAAAFRWFVAEPYPPSLGKVTARQCGKCGHISFDLLHRRVTGHLWSTL